MKDEIVHDARNVPLSMAHKIRVLWGKKSKRVSSARTEGLKSVDGATAFEHEYIVNGDRVEVNRTLDEQVAHSVYRTIVVD